MDGRDRRARASERGDRRAEQRDVAETARSPESLRVALVLGPGTGELSGDLLGITREIDEVGGLGEALGLIEVDRRIPMHVRERRARQRNEQHPEPDREPEEAAHVGHPATSARDARGRPAPGRHTRWRLMWFRRARGRRRSERGEHLLDDLGLHVLHAQPQG